MVFQVSDTCKKELDSLNNIHDCSADWYKFQVIGSVGCICAVVKTARLVVDCYADKRSWSCCKSSVMLVLNLTDITQFVTDWSTAIYTVTDQLNKCFVG